METTAEKLERYCNIIRTKNELHFLKTMVALSGAIAIGIEGSANKVGVGVVKYNGGGSTRSGDGGDFTILSNPRKTFISPPGEGFLPRDTSQHHKNHIVALVKLALIEAKVTPDEIDCICFTQGPGMGGPLTMCAIAARTLAVIWNKPLVGVNHCVAHIEMGRALTVCICV